MRPTQWDLAVVGGGIVGLATAMEWLGRFPDDRVTLLEKEPELGAHQTGHNSGVIHSGIYYRPGSLKAATCISGARMMVEFCQAHQIPYELCGKLIVAATAAELAPLEQLYHRGIANGVPGLALIGPERIRELEPHARGLRAVHVHGAGIVDYGAVARTMAELIRRAGGQIQTSTRVARIARRMGAWRLDTARGEVHARRLITCAGLYADRLAPQNGTGQRIVIAPFRGEYYEVVPQRRHLVRSMIYPVPDPALPFLGVHFTRAIDGSVHAGPNAVLALKREGYRKTDVSLPETIDLLRFPGFWRMCAAYWRIGLEEGYRSLSKGAFVRALQRLVPEIQPKDVQPGGSGVRAQAVGEDGSLLSDFDFVQGEQAVFVRNVPSPAATASLRIAQIIVDLAASTIQRPSTPAVLRTFS